MRTKWVIRFVLASAVITECSGAVPSGRRSMAADSVGLTDSARDQVYERLQQQHGITSFVCGSSGQLRRNNIRAKSSLTAVGFDRDLAFPVIEGDDDALRFSASSRTNAVVDTSRITHNERSPLPHAADAIGAGARHR
jgi:hypothetical protein